jgi:predicted transcriptional regulator
MARLTITLPDELQRALKEAAARRGTTIGGLIEESLTHYGIKPHADAMALVEKARANSALPEREALALAVRETRAARRR